MNRPDPKADADRLAALPSLPRDAGRPAAGHHETEAGASRRLVPREWDDAGGPVFAEPWQAQAFALAVNLSEQGYFTWKEWSAALAGELKAAAERGEPDDGSHYYQHWLAALERLVTARGLTDPRALLTRKDAWAEAYRRTPHGKPVQLRAPNRR